MRYFLLPLLFLSTIMYGQSCRIGNSFSRFPYQKYPKYNSAAYFEVTGNVKKITAKEISYLTFKKSDKNNLYTYDSITNGNLRSRTILEFTKDQLLETEYWVSEKDSLQLRQKYVYNQKAQLVHYDKYSDKGKFVYSEKFVYDKDLLVEKWVKSNYQSDFFLKERYAYNGKNKVVKHENLNNNKETSFIANCKGGFADTDYIEYYTYDKNDSLVKQQNYIFEYTANFLGRPEEEYFDLASTRDYLYDNGQKRSEKISTSGNSPYRKCPQQETIFDYDRNGNLVIRETFYEGRKKSISLDRFYYENNQLQLEESGFNHHIASKFYYRDSKIWKIESIHNGEVSDYSIYDEKGFVRKEKRGTNIYEYKIEYDSQGNWIKHATFRDTILIEEKFRNIEYYD